MIKSINYWSFAGGLEGTRPAAEVFAAAKAAGFEAVELCLSEAGEVSLASTDAGLARVRRAAADEGIAISSVATGLWWQWSLSDEDASVRDKALAAGRKLLDTAAALGTDAVLVIPGAVDVFFAPGAPVVPYADVYRRATDAVGKLAQHAAAVRVAMGIENVWNKFLVGPMEMAQFVDQFASPWVGAYFDVGNCMPVGYPEQWIAILGARIKRVHFKDFRRAVGTADGFVDLLAGDVDWPAVVAALQAAGYDGPVAAEMIPLYRHYPEALIENTSRAMDAILGRGR